jgi:hypothetical protein
MAPYDVLLGSSTATPQYGLIGVADQQRIALDLTHPQTICLVGAQGSGKSYTAGSIVEMALARSGVNQLVAPLAAVVFHAHRSESYPPEFVAMRHPNTGDAIQLLRARYGADPAGLVDMLVLTDASQLSARRATLPGVRVEPLRLSAAELDAEDWKALMGMDKPTLYSRMLTQILRRLRRRITLPRLRDAIDESDMTQAQQMLAHTRLDFAQTYVSDDDQSFTQYLRPGRLVIVDIRDPLAETDEVFALFTVMLKRMAAVRQALGANTLAVFDEAHRYMDTSCSRTLVEMCREMRHHGLSLVIATQNPLTIATIALIHRSGSVAWLRHLQRAIAPLQRVTAAQVAALPPGQALVWARDTTDAAFAREAVRVELRPRVTQHGGGTVLAVTPALPGETVIRQLPASIEPIDLRVPLLAQIPQIVCAWQEAPESAPLAARTHARYATAARRWLRWAAEEQYPLGTSEERSAVIAAYAHMLRQRYTRHTATCMLTGARHLETWLRVATGATQPAVPVFADPHAEVVEAVLVE